MRVGGAHFLREGPTSTGRWDGGKVAVVINERLGQRLHCSVPGGDYGLLGHLACGAESRMRGESGRARKLRVDAQLGVGRKGMGRIYCASHKNWMRNIRFSTMTAPSAKETLIWQRKLMHRGPVFVTSTRAYCVRRRLLYCTCPLLTSKRAPSQGANTGSERTMKMNEGIPDASISAAVAGPIRPVENNSQAAGARSTHLSSYARRMSLAKAHVSPCRIRHHNTCLLWQIIINHQRSSFLKRIGK